MSFQTLLQPCIARVFVPVFIMQSNAAEEGEDVFNHLATTTFLRWTVSLRLTSRMGLRKHCAINLKLHF